MAYHWRGAPDEEAAPRRGEGRSPQSTPARPDFHHALGPQGARGPPADRAGQGPRRARAAARRRPRRRVCTSATTATDLDAFKALRECVEGGRLQHAVCVGVRSDETPPELESGADLSRGRPARACAGCSRRCSSRCAFVDFLKTTVLVVRGARPPCSAPIAVLSAADAQETAPLVLRRRLVARSPARSAPTSGRRARDDAADRPPARRRAARRRRCPSRRPARCCSTACGRSSSSTVAASALAVDRAADPRRSPPGFAVIWALSWRRQDAAVTAIEERDGVQFFVERTSPFRPIKLVRAPGFRRIEPPTLGDAATAPAGLASAPSRASVPGQASTAGW